MLTAEREAAIGSPSGPEDMAKSVLWSENVRDAVSVRLHAIIWRLLECSGCLPKSALTCVASHGATQTLARQEYPQLGLQRRTWDTYALQLEDL